MCNVRHSKNRDDDGWKILGPKTIYEYNLFFSHSGANLNAIIFFIITTINNIVIVIGIYFFIIIHPFFDGF